MLNSVRVSLLYVARDMTVLLTLWEITIFVIFGHLFLSFFGRKLVNVGGLSSLIGKKNNASFT